MKDDQREAKAEIAVLVTTAFPKEVNNFSYINGILALPGKSNLRLKDVSTAATSWGCLLILKSETIVPIYANGDPSIRVSILERYVEFCS